MSNTPRPFSPLRLDHVVLRTAKVEDLLVFYQALGCEIVRTLADLGLHQLRAGDSIIDIVDVHGALGTQGGAAPGIEGRNMDHFALRIDPFDAPAVRAYLTSLDAEYSELPFPVFGAEGYGHSIYVKDPDGNTVELKGPPNADQTPPDL